MRKHASLTIRKNDLLKLVLLVTCIWAESQRELHAQPPDPPMPVEAFVGHNSLYYQVVTKNDFAPGSRLGYFGLATYTADYQNDVDENSLITIAQINYGLGNGFGVMAGTDINSVSGFSPIVGPQHNYASREWLAVTVLSYFLNGESDLKLFGLYEYKPPINEQWTFYSRLQFIVNQNLSEGSHNKSYLYLRSGLKRDFLIFGLAANLDWSGPGKVFNDNYGPFVRWEF